MTFPYLKDLLCSLDLAGQLEELMDRVLDLFAVICVDFQWIGDDDA